MSVLVDLLEEAKAKVQSHEPLAQKTVIAYDVDDLLDALKGVKKYPAAGIVYEGMRSTPENKPTSNIGLSTEVVIGILLIQQGDALHSTQEKKTISIDMLDAVRGKFLGKKSTVTNHFWHFLIESPVELKDGMVVWAQRWSVPAQLPIVR